MKLIIASLILFGCTSTAKHPDFIDADGILHLKTADDTPSCNWLKSHNVWQIQPDDTYEITTDELCGDL